MVITCEWLGEIRLPNTLHAVINVFLSHLPGAERRRMANRDLTNRRSPRGLRKVDQGLWHGTAFRWWLRRRNDGGDQFVTFVHW